MATLAMTAQQWLRYLRDHAKDAGISPTGYIERIKRQAGYCRVLWCWQPRQRDRSRCLRHLQRNTQDMKTYRHRVEDRIVKRVAAYIQKGQP